MINLNVFRKSLLDKLLMNPRIVRAEGNLLYTDTNEVIRDYLSQYGALPFGHNPSFAIGALQDHLLHRRPVFTQPIFQTATEELAELLGRLTGGQFSRCTFTNSGAEAVEAAIKLARFRTGRTAVLSVVNSFHGKTQAALAATGSERYAVRQLKDDLLYKKIRINDFDALDAELRTNQYAAFIVEPIQGEGGMYVAQEEWLRHAVTASRESGTLLIFDEVQTGLGRTGSMTIASEFGITPDVLLLAKALGGGVVPTGALLYTDRAWSLEFDRKHSSTFANNGLAAAASLAVLKELERDDCAVLAHVREISRQVDEHCAELGRLYPGVFSWRGRGLMRALQFRDACAHNNYLVNYMNNSGSLAWVICSFLMQQHNMLTVPLLSDPGSIRFEPPLNLCKSDIRDFFEAAGEVGGLIANGRYDHLMAPLIGKSRTSLSVDSLRLAVSDPALPMAPDSLMMSNDRKQGKKFAFLMHATSIPDLIRSMPLSVRKNFNGLEQQRLAELFMEVGAVDSKPEVALRFAVSNEMNSADGIMITSPISPEDMLRLPAAEKRDLMKAYLDIARREGAEVIGLGAYTSVITRGGHAIQDEVHDLTLTTGNSLTAMSTAQVVLEIARHNLIGLTVSVIGARGSVGKLVVSELAHWCDDIILVGRAGSEAAVFEDVLQVLCSIALGNHQHAQRGSVMDRIRRIAERHREEPMGVLSESDPSDCDAAVTLLRRILIGEALRDLGLVAVSDYQSALNRSDYIISATSEGKPFLRTRYVKNGAVVVDAARPFDFVVDDGFQGELVEGGLVQQPNPNVYGDCNMVGCPVGVNLACLSETIVLALSRAEGHYSIGKSIPYKEARKILILAEAYGFSPVKKSVATEVV